MRIIRTLLVLTGVTTFLPAPPEDQAGHGTVAAQAAAPEQGLLATATLAVADMASFCSRQPDVCQTAGYLANRLEAKAKYSVRLLYEWASEDQAAPVQAKADPLTTSSTKVSFREGIESQSTLKLEDLIPEWRGPAPKKNG